LLFGEEMNAVVKIVKKEVLAGFISLSFININSHACAHTSTSTHSQHLHNTSEVQRPAAARHIVAAA
jgi:hypothetical protein